MPKATLEDFDFPDEDYAYDDTFEDDEDYPDDFDPEYDEEELEELDGTFGYSDPADFEND